MGNFIEIWQLKVSISQKQFFLKLHCPKKLTKYLRKFCSIKLGQNSVKYFIHFGGQWSFKKNCFWDLLTFRTLSERLCVHPIFWPWIPFGIVAKNWLRGVSKNCKKIKIHKLTFKLSTNCCCLTKKSLGKCLQASRSIIGECNTRGVQKQRKY